MPVDIMAGPPPGQSVGCPVEYAEWLRGSMTRAHDYARQQLRKAAQRQKQLYDLRARETSFVEGQFVWRWYPPKANQKLGKGWTGPFRVMGCPTKVNVMIQYTPRDQAIRVHIDHLKLHKGELPKEWADYGGERAVEGSSYGDGADEESVGAGQNEGQSVVDGEEARTETGQGGDPDATRRRGVRIRKAPTRLDL